MSMNTNTPFQRVWPLVLLLLPALVGCEGETPQRPQSVRKEPTPAAEAKKVLVGKNVWFEVQGDKRRVLVAATVCLRMGQLEQFMTRRQTKEHEAIVAADCDARDIHKALLLTGAEAGSPVTFSPKYAPARGTKIKISVTYEEKGKSITVPANRWIRNAMNGKDLDQDWVFAGSHFMPDPLDKTQPDHYLANDGDVICVSNFEDALLDLPINSSKDNAELAFEANTERIPELKTSVVVVLEPVLEKK